MSSNIFYKGIKKAKNGKDVPLLTNGKTFFSEYNPERDIQFYAAAPAIKDAGFILIGGLADGSHINAVLDANPTAFIMVLEYNEETINYLFSEGICRPELKENPRILFTTPESLSSDLKNAYIPVLYGTFLYHPVKAWQLLCDESGGDSIKNVIQETLHDIAADYATQARFGKLMHTNVLKNLKLLSEISKSCSHVTEAEIKKFTARYTTAAVIGAGPSLDESMPLLKKNRKNLFIIATDTAYRTLCKSGISADMVVTLDGQNTSISHFLGIDSYETQSDSEHDQFCTNNQLCAKTQNNAFKNTIVAADICANAAAARYLSESGHRLFFFTTGHPLGTLVNSWYKTQTDSAVSLLPCLNAGCGTVLSAAADIAVKAGFRSILLFGADFAYKSGKPYTRGTYLDEIYSINDNRFNTSETAFSALCYRTELTKIENGYTTPLLASYKRNMDAFIKSSSSSFQFISSATKQQTFDDGNGSGSGISIKSIPLRFDYDAFLSFYSDKLKNNDNSVLYTILPYATWIKEKEKDADIKDIYAKAVDITALHRS